MSVVCLSGRGLCDGLITCPEEFYQLWCVLVCDLETSRLRRLKLQVDCKSQNDDDDDDDNRALHTYSRKY
jgi:hypothetical protein